MAGSAVAHPGHGGSAGEPGTWFVYGPVLLGGTLLAASAGLNGEGLLSLEHALLTAAVGVVLLAGGVFRWVG